MGLGAAESLPLERLLRCLGPVWHYSGILHQHHSEGRVSSSHPVQQRDHEVTVRISNSNFPRAPGTAEPHTNGCISNCGTKVKSASSGVDDARRVGYFEAWNMNRPCANMDISKITLDGYYTHVHWAFANISTNWAVDVSGQQDQFDGLLKLEKIKRILSFGGWGFSTDTYTHNIFRNGVKDGNRQILAANVVSFIVKNNLDGVDFDWEYPGAQDIPGVEPDSLDSGRNYAEFLNLVRKQLPSELSISIALPASYWYLKGFDPITQYEDYVVSTHLK
jgi:chitinase